MVKRACVDHTELQRTSLQDRINEKVKTIWGNTYVRCLQELLLLTKAVLVLNLKKIPRQLDIRYTWVRLSTVSRLLPCIYSDNMMAAENNMGQKTKKKGGHSYYYPSLNLLLQYN